MKFDHTNKWIYKFSDEDFTVDYSFTNDLATSETLSSCTVTCTDSDGNSTTSTMISGTSITSPKVYFDIAAGTADTTYQIKLVGVSSESAEFIHYITLDIYGSIILNSKLGDSDANSYVTLEEANKYIRNIRGHSNNWDTLSIEGKKRILIEACRDINKFNFVSEPYYDNQALSFPDTDHNTLSDDVATPVTKDSFTCDSFTSDTYGARRSNTNYWKHGSVHIISGTPLNDIREIDTSNITNDIILMTASFTATPNSNTDFIAFEPLDSNIKHAQVLQTLYILDNEGGDTLYNYKAAGAKVVKIGDVRVEFKEGANLSKVPMSQEAKKLMSRYIRKNIRVGRA